MSTFKAYNPGSGVVTLAAGAALDLSTAPTSGLNYNVVDYANYLIICQTTGAGNAITLPLASRSAGQTFKVVLGTATAGANCVILSGTAGSANIHGYLIGNATKVACTGVSAINIVSGTALKGDYLTFTSDGVSYYVQGFAQIAASFTTTA